MTGSDTEMTMTMGEAHEADTLERLLRNDTHSQEEMAAVSFAMLKHHDNTPNGLAEEFAESLGLESSAVSMRFSGALRLTGAGELVVVEFSEGV